MQPKEPFEYHVSILYLGSEINDLISWTVGSHSTVCRFAATSQELSSFHSEWRDEAQREGQSGHCFRCWHLLASFMQRHTSVCWNSLCLVPNDGNLREHCVYSCLVLMQYWVMFELNRTLFGKRIDFLKRATITLGYYYQQSKNRTGLCPIQLSLPFSQGEKNKGAYISASLRTETSCSDLCGKSATQTPDWH